MDGGCGKQVVSLASARAGKTGEVPKLERLYLELRPSLFALLRRRTGSDDAAAELLQDVWVRLSQVAHPLADDNLEAYLHRIAANLALDWLRRHRFRSLLTDAEADPGSVADTAPSLERAVQARQAVVYLATVIEELPAGQRDCFLAYSGQNTTVAEVARQLGLAPKTVENQIARAKATIRARMAERGLWP